MEKKAFITRTLSGAVYITLVLCAILINQYIFAAIFVTFCVFTTYEFHKITNNRESVDVLIWIGMLCSFLMFATAFFIDCHNDFYPLISLISYLLLIFSVFIAEIFRKKINPINNVAYFILGQVYTAIPFAIMVLIYQVFGFSILLAFFLCVWANDVFAYLIGSWLGKRRLCERISPKKSWEGFFGGLIGALVITFLFIKIFFSSFDFANPFTTIQWLIFALIIVIFGTLGDLFESLIKRTTGIKDSGKIIPGHGGLLDRFDSTLAAMPAILIYLMFIQS